MKNNNFTCIPYIPYYAGGVEDQQNQMSLLAHKVEGLKILAGKEYFTYKSILVKLLELTEPVLLSEHLKFIAECKKMPYNEFHNKELLDKNRLTEAKNFDHLTAQGAISRLTDPNKSNREHILPRANYGLDIDKNKRKIDQIQHEKGINKVFGGASLISRRVEDLTDWYAPSLTTEIKLMMYEFAKLPLVDLYQAEVIDPTYFQKIRDRAAKIYVRMQKSNKNSAPSLTEQQVYDRMLKKSVYPKIKRR